MEQARHILGSCGPEIDIIIARDQEARHPTSAQQPPPPTQPLNTLSAAGGVYPPAVNGTAGGNVGERRKRRKLPVIERPQSAPIYNNVVTERTLLHQGGDLTKTVITIAADDEPDETDEVVGSPAAAAPAATSQQPRKGVREEGRGVGAMKKYHQLSKSSSRIPTRQQFSGVRDVATMIEKYDKKKYFQGISRTIHTVDQGFGTLSIMQ
jgi:hypothetical protein